MNRYRPPRALLIAAAVPLFACSDELPTSTPVEPAFAAAPQACQFRANNDLAKLTACMTLDAVRAHQAALQAIADANGGTRYAGSAGHNASAAYVAARLEDAGYDVTLQPFQFDRWVAPASALEQITPAAVTYVPAVDYDVMSYSVSGDVTAPVTAVDLQLGLGNASTSGCEAADFAGFPAGHVALIQRGTCTFEAKAENAAAAGAVGVIIFNQGNDPSPSRTALFTGTLSPVYTGGIPVVSTSYDRGVEWSATPGLVMHIFVNAFVGTFTSHNVIAETAGGDPDQVIVVGGHLDSVVEGPGINDNGSGAAALLEAAVQMARVMPRNKVRFAWWSGHEFGRLGSIHYLSSLSAGEIEDIALYLNFDVIGSPNYAYFVMDGDGSTAGSGGPDGSGAIESILGGLYGARGLTFEPFPLGGSDDQVFALADIPVGGITSGAQGIKTPQEASVYGGTAGIAYDPCYHLACDTFANVSLAALDVNADIVASAVLTFAMSAEAVNGRKGKGNFKPGSVTVTSEAVR